MQPLCEQLYDSSFEELTKEIEEWKGQFSFPAHAWPRVRSVFIPWPLTFKLAESLKYTATSEASNSEHWLGPKELHVLTNPVKNLLTTQCVAMRLAI
jgi:hypothetical protein